MAEDDTEGSAEDTAVTIVVLSNDPYPESRKDRLTVSVVRQPLRGTVVVNPPENVAPPRRTITYTLKPTTTAPTTSPTSSLTPMASAPMRRRSRCRSTT